MCASYVCHCPNATTMFTRLGKTPVTSRFRNVSPVGCPVFGTHALPGILHGGLCATCAADPFEKSTMRFFSACGLDTQFGDHHSCQYSQISRPAFLLAK